MRGKDHTGKRFGRLVALAPLAERRAKKIHWKCQCDCGELTSVAASHLTGGKIRSCGCLQRESVVAKNNQWDKTGQRFGRLLVLGVDRIEGKLKFWKCLCDCGNTTTARSCLLATGHKTSCGCYRKEVTAKLKYSHGQCYTAEYKRYHTNLRSAAKDSRTPPWSDQEAIKTIYAKCPPGMNVDHIIPLRGELVSGLHVPENLQYLTKSENSRKYNRFTPQFITPL